jgi:tetratricopeptide (TPR) repeat protein
MSSNTLNSRPDSQDLPSHQPGPKLGIRSVHNEPNLAIPLVRFCPAPIRVQPDGQRLFSREPRLNRKALAMLDTLPEAPERDARELGLASALVQVLQATRGYAASETIEAAARARALAEKSGILLQLILREFSVWGAVFVAGDHAGAVALADRIFDLAMREGSETSLGIAHRTQLDVRFYRGDLTGAEGHFARMNGFIEAPGLRRVAGAIVIGLGFASLVAWTLGRADTARQRATQAIVIARENKNPFDLGFALFFESYLHRWLREPQRAECAAAQALALSEEYGFSNLRGITLITVGWARAQLGSASDGVSLLQQGLAVYAEIGARISITDYLGRLADAQDLAGTIDHALFTIDDALQANPEELVFRPHNLTRRGDLRLKIGQTERAEADFREAIALAQKMQGKAWELRATTSLARLLNKQGRRDEARTMLADIYSWFTEGFETADLKDAKALLDQLSN